MRLGYAATEHGYQSDTVTIGINLASEATTRRGLYVAVTRGRDENSIHVITDSPDVAEARDVLERILAVDRADIPAVTQRRQLAEQDQPPSRSARRRERPGRCEIPDWFDQLRDQTRQRARGGRAAGGGQRHQTRTPRSRSWTPPDAIVDRLDQPTRRQRERARRRPTRRRQRQAGTQAIAEHRLDASGLRGRRHARRDLAAADNRLTWANHTLEQLQAHDQSRRRPLPPRPGPGS